MHQHCWQWSTSVSSFFLIFSGFLAIFTLITTLGSTHRPCKLYLNIINKYTWCLSFFSWFFPDFLIIFALITRLESAHIPCKQYPQHHHHHPHFFSILLLFFMWKCKSFHIWHFLAQLRSVDFSAILVTGLWGPFQCKYQNYTISWQEWNFGW